MKIGIFETEHFEGVFPVIKLFDNSSNQITVFTYNSTYRQLKYLLGNQVDNYDWVIKAESDSKHRFIYTLFREVRKRNIGLLYLNTVTNNFIFYAALIKALQKTRIVLTLHDINGYFPYRPKFGLRPLTRYFGKRWLMGKVDEFNVVSLTMVDYLESKLGAGKKVYCIPGAVFDESTVPTLNGLGKTINIVVPGTLDRRRRKYETVFELLDECRIQQIPVNITLLGGTSESYGQEILDKCRNHVMKYDNLLFYNTALIEQPEFDRVMNAAHFVLIPSMINTMISDGVVETYGLSISSGNIFDVIKHAKPFIVPNALRIDPFLVQSCFHYGNVSDIVDFLAEILRHKERYLSLLQAALEASRNYTIEKVRQRNPDLFGTHL
jgi:glycosyltransferase involved in cell wall biosynthesis